MEEYTLELYLRTYIEDNINISTHKITKDKLLDFLSELNDDNKVQQPFTAILDINENGLVFRKDDLIKFKFTLIEESV